MSATIKTVYLPNIDDMCDTKFIVDAFQKCGIAKVRSIAIEPHIIKSTHSEIATRKYNRAYIEIHSWHDTDLARKFTKQLRDHTVETRLQYGDDNWWVVKINQFPNKLKPSSKRIFKECILSYRSALATTPTSVVDLIPDVEKSPEYKDTPSKIHIIEDVNYTCADTDTDTDTDMRRYLKEMHEAICEYSELCRLEDLKKLTHTLTPPCPWHVIYNYE